MGPWTPRGATDSFPWGKSPRVRSRVSYFGGAVDPCGPPWTPPWTPHEVVVDADLSWTFTFSLLPKKAIANAEHSTRCSTFFSSQISWNRNGSKKKFKKKELTSGSSAAVAGVGVSASRNGRISMLANSAKKTDSSCTYSRQRRLVPAPLVTKFSSVSPQFSGLFLSFLIRVRSRNSWTIFFLSKNNSEL